MKRFVPLFIALLAPLFLSMAKKKEFTVTFHAQAEEMDVPKTMFPFVLEGQRRLFKIIPEITHKNVAAFHPFPSENGMGNGIAFQLDFRGRSALELVTRTRRGQYLLAMVNGTPVDYLVIDQVVTDGMITVWQGVPDEVVAIMDKKYSRIKSGQAPTVSSNMEMTPTTEHDKKRIIKAEKEAKKKAEKDAKKGIVPPPDKLDVTIPRLSPTAPTSSQIPLEDGSGGGGASVAPVLPLPQ